MDGSWNLECTRLFLCDLDLKVKGRKLGLRHILKKWGYTPETWIMYSPLNVEGTAHCIWHDLDLKVKGQELGLLYLLKYWANLGLHS